MYKCTHKKMTCSGKFADKGGEWEGEFEVYFPEKHSRVKAIAIRTRDLNAWDSWANICRWYTVAIVQWKNSPDEWEEIYNGSGHPEWVKGHFKKNDDCRVNLHGIYPCLESLENEDVKLESRIESQKRVVKRAQDTLTMLECKRVKRS